MTNEIRHLIAYALITCMLAGFFALLVWKRTKGSQHKGKGNYWD